MPLSYNLLFISFSNLIKSISAIKNNDFTEFHIELIAQNLPCPYCGGTTHAFGHNIPKIINHPALTERKAVIVFKSQRYRCNECLKTFTETNPFTFPKLKNSYYRVYFYLFYRFWLIDF